MFFRIEFPCVCACVCVDLFTRLNYKRNLKSKRKEIEKCPFLASALVFAFAFVLTLFIPVFSCACACAYICVARVNQPQLSTLTSVVARICSKR